MTHDVIECSVLIFRVQDRTPGGEIRVFSRLISAICLPQACVHVPQRHTLENDLCQSPQNQTLLTHCNNVTCGHPSCTPRMAVLLLLTVTYETTLKNT